MKRRRILKAKAVAVKKKDNIKRKSRKNNFIKKKLISEEIKNIKTRDKKFKITYKDEVWMRNEKSGSYERRKNRWGQKTKPRHKMS